MAAPAEESWRKCSACKKPINFGAIYYVCSVSTCNGQRTGYAFCSVACFEVHLPGARHRDASAIEEQAPRKPTPNFDPTSSSSGAARGNLAAVAAASPVTPAKSNAEPRKIIVGGATKSAPMPAAGGSKEVLVIASRLKDYIHERSEMNTSSGVMDALSDHLRVVCERAIENARADGRKTVMDRDFQFLKSGK